ncbi:hypothetical protein Tsubulata_049726 [Turnera subulata]|uniref:Kinesin motor domain-containing protein n=1 Tax=Turnera subulata TaxID=218843 RepID=A0A9Q0GAM0_9ROSI|nr:hypothetical protein Tsubulata_049726 [Turnera subulata]
MMDSRKSVGNLTETLHSLLGLKAHLTSNWVKSVCDIVRNLPPERSIDLRPESTVDSTDDDPATAIAKIKDELAALTGSLNHLTIQRRNILNDFLDMKGNIRVFCRIRPMTLGENLGLLTPVVALNSNNVLLRIAESKNKSYSFDRVFQPGSSQDEVFSEVEPVIKSVIDGYNACIFAYGQTGTGKTFTMEGTPDAPGIVPRAIKALFKQATDSNRAFLISFSMLEIYMGNLKDLLVPKPTKPTDPMPPCLSIQTDLEGGIEIDNLVAIQVNDFNQALRLYRLGCRFRSTASTNSNINSSRSHCLIRIAVTCFDAPERRREANKLWLVDLGGSERVLKTKAWGKRLDEGKAINLSLSALGDVIYALQRKRRHIPYRNSKLTQVLKDSLGDDSKTLMLVHVSPREEDLCETICSLNFATRVKSIHLGNEDTTEAREQKEIAMANLQQKMEKIEDDHQQVRREIEQLNKKLENLTGISTSSQDQLHAYDFPTEEPLEKNSHIGDITMAPLSKLPRFMRPTICSRRKSGVTGQTSEGRGPVYARKRRTSSHRAESISFPVKDHTENNSEHSVSRSSCLIGLNRKNSSDNATQYSQDTSETDLLDIRKQERAPSTSSPKASTIHVQRNSSCRRNKIDDKKFLNVDNWLHLQKNQPTVSGHTHRTKRVLAVPIPNKKQKDNGHSKAENFCGEEMCNCEFKMQKVFNHDRGHIALNQGEIETPISEAVLENPLTTLKDLFNADSDVVRLSLHTSEGKTTIHTEDSVDSSLIEDNQCAILSPPEGSCGRIYEPMQHCGGTGVPIMHAVEGEIECSNGFMLTDHDIHKYCPTELDYTITHSRQNSRISISMPKLESSSQQASDVSDSEDTERQYFNDSFIPRVKETRPRLLHLSSQRALFMQKDKQKDVAITVNKGQQENQKTGFWHITTRKIEVLYASALLGLGVTQLGFEHDFFYGLML